MASATVKFDCGNIPKFDGSNFQLWKFSVTILFKAEKIISIVDGTTSEPTDKTSAEWKIWDSGNSKAQVIFLSTISQNQIQHLINCQNATEMWTRLLSIHEQKTEISKELLWQRFYDYKMPESGSIAEHISSIELLVRQLKDVKETISSSAICSKVINSLPSKFNAFRTAWDSVASDQQTFDNLAARLLKEETRMTSDDSTVSRLALEVQALQSKLDNVRVEQKKSLRNRNIQDLKKNSCCNYCKKKGHWVRECRKRIVDSKKNTEKLKASTSSAYICDISMLYYASSGIEKSDWICDSGASMHMTGQKDWFSTLQLVDEPIFVRIANDKLISATGKGVIEIQACVEGQWFNRSINNVLYIPELGRNLFSVGAMTDKNFTHHSSKNRCEFRDREGKVSCVGVRKNNLWIMQFRIKSKPECNLSISNKNSLKLWHDRLGHVNFNTIKRTADMVPDLVIDDKEEVFCEMCQFGKQARKPHKSIAKNKNNNPGEMIHSDVCGPMNVTSPSGSRYFVLFKDDASGYRTVYFLKHKSDVFEKFKVYKSLVENQTGNKIKVLRSDQGMGEYMNREFQEFLTKEGISHECSAPYTPQQNGRSEREMRTIVESARTMMLNKNVPQEMWSEAVNTAVYILNRTASSQIKDMTAYEMWFRRKPETKHLRIFGSPAYMSIPTQFRKKWDPKSRKLMFVGYEGYSTNYRLWDSEKRRIEISCNVNFNELEKIRSEKENFSFLFKEFEDIEENDKCNSETESESPIDISDFYDDDFECDLQLNENDINERRQLRDRSKLTRPDYYGVIATEEPFCYEEAIQSKDQSKWLQAMEEEMDALKKNHTWDLVKLPDGCKVIDNKWVFRIKHNDNSDTDNSDTVRYKARLVARGFTQEKGVDYNETFAPVVRFDSIRILLALAAEKALEITTFDVKTAFLYGDLSECVYMKQPIGFEDKENKSLVCKLNRSLYGLKQSPRCWNFKFVSFLNKYKLKQLKTDECVFIGCFANFKVYLAIYVDDGLLLSKSKIAINELIHILQETFEITVHSDSRKINFVGLEIEQDISAGTILVHQHSYILKLLDRFHMTDSKPMAIPFEPGIRLSSAINTATCNKNQPYREAVGSLIFLATSSRPDITFAVNQVSRFFNEWSNEQWVAVKRIFRYLKHTIQYKIRYSKTNKIEVMGYTDADYAGCIDTRKSTSGYVFMFAGGPITWKSQKQNVVAQSTTEAEYVALGLGVKEALWLKSLFKELYIDISRVEIKVDNQSAIKLTKAQQLHSRTKHIDVKVHFVRDECQKGNISVNYVCS